MIRASSVAVYQGRKSSPGMPFFSTQLFCAAIQSLNSFSNRILSDEKSAPSCKSAPGTPCWGDWIFGQALSAVEPPEAGYALSLCIDRNSVCGRSDLLLEWVMDFLHAYNATFDRQKSAPCREVIRFILYLSIHLPDTRSTFQSQRVFFIEDAAFSGGFLPHTGRLNIQVQDLQRLRPHKI